MSLSGEYDCAAATDWSHDHYEHMQYRYSVPISIRSTRMSTGCGPISVWSSLTSQPRNALPSLIHRTAIGLGTARWRPPQSCGAQQGALSGGAHPMGDTPTISGSIVSHG